MPQVRFKKLINTKLAFVLFFFGIFLTPTLIEFSIERIFSSSHDKINIEQFELNFFPPGVKISNLSLNNLTQIELAQIEFDHNLLSLFKKRINIKHIDIKNIRMTGPIATNDKKTSGVGLLKYWKIQVKNLSLTSDDLYLASLPKIKIINLKSTDVEIFSKEFKFALQGEVNVYGGLARFKGEFSNKGKEISSKFKLDLKKIKLSESLEALKLERVFEGNISSNLDLAFKNKALEVSGSASLDQLMIRKKGFEMSDFIANKVFFDIEKIVYEKGNLTSRFNSIKFSNPQLSAKADYFLNRYQRVRHSEVSLKKTNINFKKDDAGHKLSIQSRIGHRGKVDIVLKEIEKRKKLSIIAKKINLVPFSSTLENIMGYSIKNGALTIDYNVSTNRGRKSGQAQVKLHQFDINSNDEKNNSLESKTMIPLATAILSVKNSKGDIEIELNLDGDPQKTDVSLFPTIKKSAGEFLIEKLGNILVIKLGENLLPMVASAVPFSPVAAFKLAKSCQPPKYGQNS